MKKILTILSTVCLSLLSLSNKNISTLETLNLEENDNIYVSNNSNNYSLDDIKNLNNSKDIFIYDINKKISDEYCAIYYKRNNDAYYFLETTSLNLSSIKDEIKEFYNEKLLELNKVSITNNSYSNFKDLHKYHFTKNFKPYGRIVYDYKSYHYDFCKESSLIYVKLTQEFICGSLLNKNDESGYGNYKNYGGYTHMKAIQNVSDYGYNEIRKGGKPVIKDYFPLSKPSASIITTTYGEKDSHGGEVTIGYSTNNGFEAEIGGKKESEVSISYSKSYSDDEPSLSTQHGETENEFQWTYLYSSPQEKTNLMNLGYIFELNNYEDGNNVALIHDFLIQGKMVVVKDNDISNEIECRFLKTL